MQSDVMIEIIKIVPNILWFLFAVILVVILYRPIMREIVPRMSGVSAFGIEAKFIRNELDKVTKAKGVNLSENVRSQILGRIQRSIEILKGGKVLWVDDTPENVNHECQILRTVGIFIDIVKTSDAAIQTMLNTRYDVVVSDMKRDNIPDEGLRFLKSTVERGIQRPTIFFVGNFDPNALIPSYVFGITNRSDELLHLVMDALERERG